MKGMKRSQSLLSTCWQATRGQVPSGRLDTCQAATQNCSCSAQSHRIFLLLSPVGSFCAHFMPRPLWGSPESGTVPLLRAMRSPSKGTWRDRGTQVCPQRCTGWGGLRSVALGLIPAGSGLKKWFCICKGFQGISC